MRDQPSVQPPPWNRPDAFPAKPPLGDYGYVAKGRLQPCMLEELVAAVAEGDRRGVSLVWTPASDRLVPPEAVADLYDGVRARLKARARATIISGIPWLIMAVIVALSAMGSPARGSYFWSMAGILLLLGGVPVAQGLRQLSEALRLDPDDMAHLATHARYALWMGARPARATWMIAGGLIAIFMLQLTVGMDRSIVAAALVKSAVRAGQWWRLITAITLHGNVMHLLFNTMALLALGHLIEVTAGRARLAIVFITAAIVGSVTSLVYLPASTSVGASGGLMGLIGFAVVLGFRRRATLPPGFTRSMILSVALVAAMGIVGWSMIDNAAHAGGLVAGLATALALVSRNPADLPPRTPRPVRIASAVAWLAIAATFAAAAVALLAAPAPPSP